MNENTLEGGAKAGLGELESKAGAALDDGGLRAGGAKAQVQGEVRKAVGSAQEAIAPVADQARALAGRVGEQAKDVYGQAQDRAQAVADRVDPFVKEQPYAALGIAAAAGLLMGLLLASRGPKVVYVKPRG